MCVYTGIISNSGSLLGAPKSKPRVEVNMHTVLIKTYPHALVSMYNYSLCWKWERGAAWWTSELIPLIGRLVGSVTREGFYVSY